MKTKKGKKVSQRGTESVKSNTSVQKKKKHRFAYTEEDVRAAVFAVRSKKLSLGKACAIYGVPKATLCNKVNGKSPLVRRMGPQTVLTAEEENKIAKWVIEKTRIGNTVHHTMVKQSVKRMIEKLKRPNPFVNNCPGRKWLELFLQRHPEIQHKVSCGKKMPSRAKPVEEDVPIVSSKENVPVINVFNLEAYIPPDVLQEFQDHLSLGTEPLSEKILFSIWKTARQPYPNSYSFQVPEITSDTHNVIDVRSSYSSSKLLEVSAEEFASDNINVRPDSEDGDVTNENGNSQLENFEFINTSLIDATDIKTETTLLDNVECQYS